MATSGVITGTLTVREIVNHAYALIGVKDANTELSAEDAQLGMTTLTWMLKSWQADGNNLWRREAVTIPWPAATPAGDLDPDIMDILSLRWGQDGIETPMRRYMLEEWDRLPTREQPGAQPMGYCFVKKTDGVMLLLTPVPIDGLNLYGDIARIIDTVTDLDQTIDIPQEWTEAVFYNLAARLADPAGKVGERINRVLSRAEFLYTKLRGHDREPSLYFRPRARYGGWGWGYGYR